MTVMRGYMLPAYRRLFHALYHVPVKEWGLTEVSDLALILSSGLGSMPQAKEFYALESLMRGEVPDQSVADRIIERLELHDPVWMYERGGQGSDGLWSIVQVHGPGRESWVATLPSEVMVIEVIEAFDNPSKESIQTPVALPDGCEVHPGEGDLWRAVTRDHKGRHTWVADARHRDLAAGIAYLFLGRPLPIKDTF